MKDILEYLFEYNKLDYDLAKKSRVIGQSEEYWQN